MVELNGGNIDIALKGYRTFCYCDEQCRVFFKGSVSTKYLRPELEEWIGSLVIREPFDRFSFCSHLAHELNNVSGLFGIIIKKGNSYYIISDIIRSIPLFYGFSGRKLFITDNLDEYQNKNGSFAINNDKLEEYIASGFVYGNGTIFNNVYAIQAAEIVEINELEVSCIRYFEFKPATVQASYKTLVEFSEAFNKVLLSVFRRLTKQTPDVDRWVVPLSGGHDSRLIVNCFSRLGLKNVVCFSYGISDNEQSRLSRLVAEALDFEWHFVEYTEQKWKDLHEQGIIDEFIRFAFNGSSIPHLQDFLAVYEMKERNILRANDVLVPGHTFDFLAGSNLEHSDLDCTDKEMAVVRVLMMHSRITDMSRPPVRTVEEIYDKANIDPEHFQEYFNWQEKRAKFLVNTCRGYEFFGLKVCLPFWDRELVNFWLKIPDSDRIGRKIFLESEETGILDNKLLSIPFWGKDDRLPTGKFEDLLRRFLPDFVKTIILKVTGHKAKYNAGLNQIYALKASTVKELLDPIEDFPSDIRSYFGIFLNRYPFQIDYHFMTSLYTVRMQLNRIKKQA